jgi:hypothetical protein
LWLNGHGTSQSFNDFDTKTSTKIKGLNSNTQILLDSCQTAGNDIKESIAYKIARDNGVVVFGATDSITHIQNQLSVKMIKVK